MKVLRSAARFPGLLDSVLASSNQGATPVGIKPTR